MNTTIITYFLPVLESDDDQTHLNVIGLITAKSFRKDLEQGVENLGVIIADPKVIEIV